ncbi:MAG: glycosyltransferase [Chitinophagaceae bacterium]
MILTSLFLLLTAAYLLLFVCYLYGWLQTPAAVTVAGFVPDVPVSVVIAARNEEAVIGACIQSLLALHYPSHLLEVIIVDDDSSDATATIVSRFGLENVRCIRAPRPVASGPGSAFKKIALDAGIHAAKGELIITSDADCTFPAEWLSHIAFLYRKENPVMIVAPVRFENDGSLCERFQEFDFMTMQGITAATRYWNWGVMCNGANLAFSKHAYHAVQGYSGTDHIISGDDYLLMLKMLQHYPDQICYLKSAGAAVLTQPQPDWKSFIQQRLRWSSKSGRYSDPRMAFILVLVYLFNVSLLLASIGAAFSLFPFRLVLFSFLLKVFVETLFLASVHQVYPLRKSLLYFPLLQPLHIIYITLIGGMSRFGRFEWKGRKAVQS